MKTILMFVALGVLFWTFLAVVGLATLDLPVLALAALVFIERLRQDDER